MWRRVRSPVKADHESADGRIILDPALGGAASEQADHRVVRGDDPVRGTVSEVLEPCVQVSKVMVWMFFGLLPASSGQLFDREHVRCVSDGGTR